MLAARSPLTSLFAALAIFTSVELALVERALAKDSVSPSATRPNILIVVADDVGVDKVGVYREGECFEGKCPSPPATPALDELAERGVLFRNAWSNPLCSTARATLLTGRFGFRTRVGGALPGYWEPQSRWLGVDPAAPNIANTLSKHGYATAAFGKWHMAGCPAVDGKCTGAPIEYAKHPVQSGFDYYAGPPTNFRPGEDYCSWHKVIAERTGVEGDAIKTRSIRATTYATVDAVDDAISKIPTLPEPWFVWLAFSASHVPLHVVPEDPKDCRAEKSEDARAMYDAMTAKLSSEVGRLLDALELPGSPESKGAGPSPLANTAVIFVGDNGTSKRAIVPPHNPGHSKGKVYEGGINVPLIIAGPKIASSIRGSESKGLVNTTDLFATVMDLAEIEACPAGAGCAEDSVSLLPILSGAERASTREFAYSERFSPGTHEAPTLMRQAVREARYKLVRQVSKHRVELRLFDLDRDPFEEGDLLASWQGGQATSKGPEGPRLDAGALAGFERLGAELERLTGVCVGFDDADSDCVADAQDNCPTIPNGPLEADAKGRGDQLDTDGDGAGDPCDAPTRVLVFGKPDQFSAQQQLLVHALRSELHRAQEFEVVAAAKISSRLERAVGQRDAARVLRSGAREKFDEAEWDEAVRGYQRALISFEKGVAAPSALRELYETLAMLAASQAAQGSVGSVESMEFRESAASFDRLLAMAPEYRPAPGVFSAEMNRAFEAAKTRVREAPTPKLRVGSDPPDAALYVDDRFVGVAPIHDLELTAGSHYVRAELPRHRWRIEAFELGLEGRGLQLRLSESKELDAASEVGPKLFAASRAEARAAADALLESSGGDEIWAIEGTDALRVSRWRKTGDSSQLERSAPLPESLSAATPLARRIFRALTGEKVTGEKVAGENVTGED